MKYDADEMTAAERPRKRILVSAVAVLLPVVALVGAAAWFVRSYVLPPTVSFESKAIASAVASPAAEPETTGASPPPAVPNSPEPAVRYSSNSAEVWAAVPIPGPPRTMQRLAGEPAAVTSEPVSAAVPLPPRRPQQSVNDTNGPVPLPRPRPTLASN
jgi:hypothetical protein